MGRYDKDTKKKSKVSTGLVVALMIVLMGVGLILIGSDKGKPMCDEVIDMMFNDPDHQRLHESYPTTMSNLHKYMDDNCDTVDEDNPLSLKP